MYTKIKFILVFVTKNYYIWNKNKIYNSLSFSYKN